MVQFGYLATSTQTSLDLLKWIGLLIVLVVAGGWAVMHIRRRLFEEDKHEPLGVLEHLRQAVRDGEMTQEEFEQAKKAMSAKLRGEPDAAPKAPNLKPDPKPDPPRSGDKPAQPPGGADEAPDAGPADSPDDPPKG